MNRQKYINSYDYRVGYDDGIEDGRKQILKKLEHVNDEIKKINFLISELEGSEAKNDKNRM